MEASQVGAQRRLCRVVCNHQAIGQGSKEIEVEYVELWNLRHQVKFVIDYQVLTHCIPKAFDETVVSRFRAGEQQGADAVFAKNGRKIVGQVSRE